MNILVTGCAGFIGFHTCLKLLNNKNYKVYGIDNINNYYDTKIKLNRLKILKNKSKNFLFSKFSIVDQKKLSNFFKKKKIEYVVHLAAQAGVRYSIKHPDKYFESNLKGFFNILECCRLYSIKHLLFASTSSVYGKSNKFPLTENTSTDKPLSFYAATKKSNEVMAYSYSNIYNIPCTGLRFFTVYGPYGRPDMALYLFADSIKKGKTLKLFNNGIHERDFTYVDDVANALTILIKKPSKDKDIPYNIFNIGNGNPKKLLNFIKQIENNLKLSARTKNFPLQKGDVIKTHASVSKLKKYINFKPVTDIDVGVAKFVKWFIKK